RTGYAPATKRSAASRRGAGWSLRTSSAGGEAPASGVELYPRGSVDAHLPTRLNRSGRRRGADPAARGCCCNAPSVRETVLVKATTMAPGAEATFHRAGGKRLWASAMVGASQTSRCAGTAAPARRAGQDGCPQPSSEEAMITELSTRIQEQLETLGEELRERIPQQLGAEVSETRRAAIVER